MFLPVSLETELPLQVLHEAVDDQDETLDQSNENARISKHKQFVGNKTNNTEKKGKRTLTCSSGVTDAAVGGAGLVSLTHTFPQQVEAALVAGQGLH